MATYLPVRTLGAPIFGIQQFIANGAVSPGCIASMDTVTPPSNFNLELSCGDTTILTFWDDKSPFTIESIVPNPAQDKLFIALTKSAPISYELLDELGNVRLSGPDVPAELDLTSLPEGVYVLRFSSNGYILSRKFAIVR